MQKEHNLSKNQKIIFKFEIMFCLYFLKTLSTEVPVKIEFLIFKLFIARTDGISFAFGGSSRASALYTCCCCRAYTTDPKAAATVTAQ